MLLAVDGILEEQLKEQLKEYISQHKQLMTDLGSVRDLGLPQCYIAAGYIRNYVWDLLHGLEGTDRHTDIDVVYFDPEDVSVERDIRLEELLRTTTANPKWSVKNQARMHVKNGDEPYNSTQAALTYWPETATAVGARLNVEEELELCCPYGLGDLFALRVRRSPNFHKPSYYLERVAKKQWKDQWPQLTISDD
ncbi:nucleotidyltransferase family protein [Paenibacillus sp. p3-SID867]|nr:nucleotidyltransferase family protein [Paenibacillus sp. p3-SID867]MCT1399236.1 nucleotidyltransferase family protein [Paenibacillus sp. p3-SID867]